MTAPVSVVIPTLEAADRIGPCLGALGAAVMEGVIHEVIVADGGSADAIAEVAEAVGARLVTAPRGRGKQLAAGARAARGDWLLFLHADTVLAPGWGAAVLAHVRARPERAGYFALRFDAPGPMAGVVAGWANLRAALAPAASCFPRPRGAVTSLAPTASATSAMASAEPPSATMTSWITPAITASPSAPRQGPMRSAASSVGITTDTGALMPAPAPARPAP